MKISDEPEAATFFINDGGERPDDSAENRHWQHGPESHRAARNNGADAIMRAPGQTAHKISEPAAPGGIEPGKE